MSSNTSEPSSTLTTESIFFECPDEDTTNEVFIKSELEEIDDHDFEQYSEENVLQNDEHDNEIANVPDVNPIVKLTIRDNFKKLFKTTQNNANTNGVGKTFYCKFCPKKFTEGALLKKHISIHSKKYFCVLCNEVFDSQPDLVDHEQQHIAERSKYFCIVCHRYFFTRSNLNRHMKTHEGKIRTYPCIKCNLNFSDEKLLAKHNKIHYYEKSYTCHDCGKTFYKKNDIKRHVTVHQHQSRLMCKFCQKIFVHQSSLTVHEKLHASVTYTCKFCFREFSLQSNLMVHEIQHTNESPFPCPFCKISFIEKKTLIIHVRKHLDEKPYVCDKCDKPFIRQASLIRHRKLHDEARPYKCPKCDKSFVTNSTLIPHLRIHMKDKPYACDRCDRRFRLKKTLIRHVREHPPVEIMVQQNLPKLHDCTQCDKKFYKASSLRSHMIIHAPKKTEQFISSLKSRFKSLLHSYEVKQMNGSGSTNKNGEMEGSSMDDDAVDFSADTFLIPQIKMEPEEIIDSSNADNEQLTQENTISIKNEPNES